MSGNVKQATLKKLGFTRHVEHGGEDIDVYIPDYVDKTGLVCPSKHVRTRQNSYQI